MKKLFVLIFFVYLVFGLFAQDQSNLKTDEENDIYLNWHLKSPVNDIIYGAEINKAYETYLKNKKSISIIVAVIDGGIDITHEDLKDNMWVNTKEIPDNGIDDDNNGYIDDIYGWNFLGNNKGENIDYENLEVTRIYKQYKNKFEGLKSNDIPKNEKETFKLYQEAKEIYLKSLKEAEQTRNQINIFTENYLLSEKMIKSYLNKEEFNMEDLNSINTDDKDFRKIVEFQKYLLQNGFSLDQLDEMKKLNDEELDYHLNIDFNPRDIIGDNQEELTPGYGNNNVYGAEADHGTFVAGIIAAIRNNNIGINGIADNVKIMALKVVPNGDERDKDVANAIRYAADNGAKIINMSFGKDLSPQKRLVNEAVLYAQSKGLLLLHAAGNDAANLDKEKNFPTKQFDKNTNITNWITVGATTMTADLSFVADFSNYGKKSVDLFAPGVNIKSLAPESKYDVSSGTSFSSPVVSGVAALIWSYYPELTAVELKNIILNSTNTYPDLIIHRPNLGSKKNKKTGFKNLSVTGGIVSAYKAFNYIENQKQ